MLKKVTFALALIAMASYAGAASFDANGTVFEPTYGYNHMDRVGLVNDGSFEDGTCTDGLSGWTCTTDNTCDWITDLAALGLWNYDGMHIAWLGGFCGSVARAAFERADQALLRTCFEAKGKLSARMAMVPTWLIDIDEPALLGLSHAAAHSSGNA